MDDIHLNCKDYVNKEKICYSCGKLLCENNKCKRQPHCKISKTLDHIPPKGLFEQNKGYPNIISNPEKNKITVPCCRECNNTYSKDEENFLLYITMIAAAKGNKIAEYALRNRYRTLDNNKKLGRNYVNNMKGNTYMPTESGILEKGIVFGLNRNIEVESIRKILTKIVRGFYYKYTNKILSKEVFWLADNVFYMKKGLHYYLRNPIPEYSKPLLEELNKCNGIISSKKDFNRMATFYNEQIESNVFNYSFIRFQNETTSLDDVLFVLKFYNDAEFILGTQPTESF